MIMIDPLSPIPGQISKAIFMVLTSGNMVRVFI